MRQFTMNGVREASKDYKKQVYFSFDDDTREEITKNIIKSLEVGL